MARTAIFCAVAAMLCESRVVWNNTSNTLQPHSNASSAPAALAVSMPSCFLRGTQACSTTVDATQAYNGGIR